MRAYRTTLIIAFLACWASAMGAADLADSYYHFSLGKMYQFRESYPLALKEYQEALKTDPESAEVRLAMAETMFEMGDISKAVSTLQGVVQSEPENLDAHLMLGRIFSEARSQDDMRKKALAEFEKALELDSKNLEALQNAAELRGADGDFEKAVEYYERFREEVPNSIGACYSEAEALIALNRLDDAIKVLKVGLEIRDDIPDYVLRLAQLLTRQGRFDEAIEVYQRGLNNGSGRGDGRLQMGLAEVYLRVGKGSDAAPLLEKLSAAQPADAEVRYDLARAYLDTNRLNDAQKILEDLEKQSDATSNPSSVEVGIALANTLAGQGEIDQAADKVEALLKSDTPQDPAIHLLLLKNLALLRERQSRRAESRRAEAIDLLKQVIEADPQDMTSKLQLVEMYSRASRNDEALALSKSLLDAHPDDPYVLIARGRALAAAGKVDEGVGLLENHTQGSSHAELLYLAASQIYLARDQFDGAQRVVEHGLTVVPSSQELRFQLGAIYERQANYGAAENEFKQVLDARPDYAEALNYLGYMLAERGVRLSEALDYVKRAVELEPHNGAFLDSLGWVYFKQDNLEKAEVHLREAARLESTDSTILEHLGDLYARKGDVESARRFYQDSIRYSDRDEDSRRVQQKLEKLVPASPGS